MLSVDDKLMTRDKDTLKMCGVRSDSIIFVAEVHLVFYFNYSAKGG